MTNARVRIEDIVKAFLFKNKLSDDDYFIYLEHAYDVVRNLRLFHDKYHSSLELTTDSLSSADLPQDLLKVIKVYNEYEGRMWIFTEKKDMYIKDPPTDYRDDQIYGFGGRGAINPYYYKIDWSERKIYIDGLGANETFYIDYLGTGISETTELDDSARDVVDTYLRWKYAEINNMSPTERRERERIYTNALLMFRRLNIPTSTQMKDKLRSLYSQVIQR